jgi:Bacterial PH domain
MDPVPSTPVSPPPPPAANHLASQHSAAPVPTTRQAVTGVVPPDVGEAMIREIRPTVLAGGGAIPGLARTFMKTIVLAPVGWLLLGPLFAKKLLPFISRRYTLTNRRLMIQHGLKPSPVQEVQLRDIDDVRLVDSSRDSFYRSGTLEVLSGGKVVLTLPGVPEPEGFRRAIRSAVSAWVPGKPAGPFVPASAAKS